MKRAFSFLSIALAALAAPVAMAQETLQERGIAKPWQLDFQEPASPMMEKLVWLHDHFLLYIITAITIFVLLLTLYILIRFSHKRNPVPSRTSHNTTLEIVWTVIPILILVAIAVPSLRTHYFMARPPEKAMTIKVTGHQWYWSYEYPDNNNIAFDSYMVKDADIKEGQHRLLEVDNSLVVPVDTPIVIQLTSADVIHAWALPAMGVKKDAVPGRLNQTWFQADKTGVYYGQCSELCGVGHGFMPIRVEVVSKEDFLDWVRKTSAPAEEPKPAAAAPKPTAKRPALQPEASEETQDITL